MPTPSALVLLQPYSWELPCQGGRGNGPSCSGEVEGILPELGAQCGVEPPREQAETCICILGLSTSVSSLTKWAATEPMCYGTVFGDEAVKEVKWLKKIIRMDP
jgi:hypothetical protein